MTTPIAPLAAVLRALRASKKLCFFASIALAAGACSETSGPAKPTSITLDAAQPAEGTVGAVVTPAPTFTVKDQQGNAMAGVDVSIAVTSGGGTLTNAPSETSAGPTSIGQWQLGTAAGPNTLTITVQGLDPIVITVNAKPGPPASIVVISGNHQSGLAGAIVQVPPTIQVRDQFGNPIPGIAVSISVEAGEGSVGNSTVTTSATGNAVITQWRLGKSDIPQVLRVTAGSLSTTISASIQTEFNVDVRFFGPPVSDAAQEAFTAAAARVRGAVIGDLPNVNAGAGVSLDGCFGFATGQVISGIIDDVVIYAHIAPIDGPGKVLGRAGPCFIRNPGSQTIVGIMQFDSDDIQALVNNGRLRDVIQHEMLHVVGIGTLWAQFGVIQGAGTADSRYTGANGVAACIAIGGSSACSGSIPVENQGGAGTADGHWRETVFVSELMTGFLGGFNPLSAMSIQSLSDVGYVVNQASSDAYSVPGQAGSALLRNLLVDPEASAWEVVMPPQFRMTTTGRVTRVEKQ